MRWTTANVRQSFLDFFKERGHAIYPSASLVPKGDPTLLFTNAGMVVFKDYFLGVRTPPDKRVADCQKCLRISGKHNDLEAVGRDTYHHTFFEMLGNWSFGDYYKKEAIHWHWELITKVWGVDPKLLYATVHHEDQEAEEVWLNMGVLPRERIMRFGDKDNFWEMGETGPCGPNSEIDIDRGPSACNGAAHRGVACGVNVDGCERYIELANLVFIQYNREAAGALTPLPMKCVDTGSGLERITAALQSLETGRVLGDYDIDVFQAIIQVVENFVTRFGNAKRYRSDPGGDISYRAIADHIRAISFLIADGVRPGREGRQYVVRRLLRRAVWHATCLEVNHPSLLPECCDRLVEVMGAAYPELSSAAEEIRRLVVEEESQFRTTVDQGRRDLEGRIAFLKARNEQVLPGSDAFYLYDTKGFPLDLTQSIVAAEGMTVDTAGFDRLMDEQRERARAARGRAEDGAVFDERAVAIASPPSSRFVGYDKYEAESEILAIVSTENLHQLVVAETPFYPEGGGQVGDRGVIEVKSGAIFEVLDTKRSNGSIIHVGKILRGERSEFLNRAHVTLKVDRMRRDAAMLNHSATHILHYALRDLLGTHVHQAGSLVSPDHLRFDFSHQGPVGEDNLLTIEEEINARIRENAAVTTEEMAYDDAIKAGALAFFGDKYGDRVRVVRMGDFSVELCGGTHVSRTGDVGLFKLSAESGVAAGVRRIEAMTGQGALESVRRQEKILDEIAGKLGARDAAALERLERILAREKELEKKLRAMEQKLAEGGGSAAGPSAETVREAGGVKIVTRRVDGVEARALREMADRVRQKHGSCVVAIGSDLGEGKAALIVAVTPDLTSKVKAGEIIRKIAPIVGGSGGGRPDFAQAGGKDAAKLGDALAAIVQFIKP